MIHYNDFTTYFPTTVAPNPWTTVNLTPVLTKNLGLSFGEAATKRFNMIEFEEKEDGFINYLDLPGCKKENICIEVDGDMIKITSTKTRTNEKMVVTGSLPKNAGEVLAKFEDGELTINVAKMNKKIKVLLS